MKIKWIFLDMDGTLLDSQKNLPKDFFKLKSQLEAQGIQFGLASGRQYARIRTVVSPYDDDFMYITDNGTMCFHHHQNLIKQEIEHELAIQMIKTIITEMNIDLVVNTTQGAVFHSSVSQDILEDLKEYYEDYRFVDDFTTLTGITKLSLYDAKDEFFNKEVLDQYKSLANVTGSGPTWIDIVSKESSKGHALNDLAHLYQVDLSEVMVFGDAMNDYDMLKIVGHPVIMANADPFLKQQGYRMTASNDEDGVCLVLRELVNAK